MAELLFVFLLKIIGLVNNTRAKISIKIYWCITVKSLKSTTEAAEFSILN